MLDTSVALERPQPRHAKDCPVETWLALLGHRWCAVILWHLNEAPMRFGELQERLAGVSPKVLAERLDMLTERQVINRSSQKSFPPVVRYHLTPRGRRIVGILDQFEQLA